MAKAKQSKRERAGQLHALYRRLKKEYSELHRQMDKMSELYFLDHWVEEGEKKEGEARITLPTHTNTVDMAHALLVNQRRRFHVVPNVKTVQEQKRTTEMEQWLRGVFHVNMVRSQCDAVGMAIWNALVKKVGWVRCRWDTALAEQAPGPMLGEPPMPIPSRELMPELQMGAIPPMPVGVAQYKELPIVIESVAPENVFVRQGGPRGCLYLFYAAKRTMEDVVAEFGLGVLPKDSRFRAMTWDEMADEEVDFIEYWGWSPAGKLMTATMADNEFLLGFEEREAEGYDRIPYVGFYCFRTPMKQPHLAFRGLLDASQDLVHTQEKLLSSMMHALKMFSTMPLLAVEGSGAPIVVDSTLGNVVHLGPGQDVRFPQWPGSPPDIMRLLNITEDKIQESGFPAVAFGRGQSGTSGYAIGQYNEGARARLNLPRSNTELALTELSHLIIGLAENFAPDVAIPVWGRDRNKTYYTALTGRDMQGHVINVSIEENLPADQLRNATIGAQLKTTGVMSNQTIAEKWLGVEDWDEEWEKMQQEQLMQHPLFKLITFDRLLSVDRDPAAQLVRGEIAKLANQMAGGGAPMPSPGAQAQAKVPGAPAPGMGAAPTPKPPMMPSNVIPPIAQGQVLSQEMGMPPNMGQIMGMR